MAGHPCPELVEAVETRGGEMERREVPVVTHGDWCLPNVVLDPDTIAVVGDLDVDRMGLADRYQDLALMDRGLRSARLNPQYGGLHAKRFLARCGHSETDDDKLGFYRLLDELF